MRKPSARAPRRKGVFDGLDSGIRPTFALVGDTEYPRLLAQGLKAVGFVLMPASGTEPEPLFLALLFGTAAQARECFSRFRSWMPEASRGDAVGISFIEYDCGEYGLCVTQAFDAIIDRMLSDYAKDEYEPLALVPAHLKMFPRQSDAYHWFKRRVAKRSFTLVGAGPDGELLMDTAIEKSELLYFSERTIPDDRPEMAFRNRNLEGNLQPPELVKRPAPDRDEVCTRRTRLLRRFFPISLELLSADPTFLAMSKALVATGYREWQVLQGACNIGLHNRFPQLKECAAEQHTAAAWDLLRAQPERIVDSTFPKPCVSRRELSRQIDADERYLAQAVDLTNEAPVTRAEVRRRLDEQRFRDCH